MEKTEPTAKIEPTEAGQTATLQTEASDKAAALECPIAVCAVRGKGFGAFPVAAVPAGARACSYPGEAPTTRRAAHPY